MPDSAYNYTATIKSIGPRRGGMTVQYVYGDSGDSVGSTGFEDIVIAIPLTNEQFNDSDIQATIKEFAQIVNNKWDFIDQADSASPTFDDSDYVNQDYNFRRKLLTEDTEPAFNPLTSYLSPYDSEGTDEIRTKYNILSLDSDGKSLYRSSIRVTREQLWDRIRKGGYWEKASVAVGRGAPIHASWDGTSAGSFAWGTDKISSWGVDSVSRQAEGIYRVHFLVAMDDSTYTVNCTAGSTDYSGAGASPRTMSVYARTPEYVDVIMERSDDAVNEDNLYFGVSINRDGGFDSAEVEFNAREDIFYDDRINTVLKSAFGLNDSDYAAFLSDNDYGTY